MNILTEIVNLLSDDKNSLSSALLKLKVLSSRLDNNELSNWINKEINGYSNNDILPEYRKHPSIVKCNYVNGNGKVTKHTVPFSIFPTTYQDVIKQIKLPQGISALEAISKDQSMHFEVPPSVNTFIERYYV